jgi:hypothetical protein
MRDTIDMAREAGLLTWLKPPEDVIERFKAFEALVRADERAQALAAQPAIPDAIHHTDLSEHPQYIEGWNDCRAEMLKGMKP